jgi:hypothetical protein
MDSIKDTADLTDNNSLKPRNPVKSKFIPILFLLLLIAGVALYFLTGFKFSKKNQEVITDSMPAENENVESPFGELVKNDDETDTVSIEQYLKIYEDYNMSYQGRPYKFLGFDKDSKLLTLSRVLPGEGTLDSPKSYKLAQDFLINCIPWDPAGSLIDFSSLSDFDKKSIVVEAIQMSDDKKYSILESYPIDTGIGVVLNGDYDIEPEKYEIKKLLIKGTDPEYCYTW